MAKKALTKDEQYLVKLKEIAITKGHECTAVCRYLVGTAMSVNPKSVDGIVKHLAQTNFVKRGEGTEIHLTPNGLNLIAMIETK